jgi:hypothetical protein
MKMPLDKAVKEALGLFSLSKKKKKKNEASGQNLIKLIWVQYNCDFKRGKKGAM